MPERHVQILSTKVLDSELIELANRNNVLIDCINFIETSTLDDVETIKLSREIAACENTVVFTSANAVYAVADLLEGIQPSWLVYCLQGSTMTAVKEQLPGAHILTTALDATELAKKIIKDFSNGQLFFFCGNKRMDNLPTLISNSGIQMTEVYVYETILKPEKIKSYYDGIIFYSPSGVSSFFMENSTTDDVTFFTIGRTTANTLSNFLNELVVSPEPDVKILVQTVINYYNNQQK